MSYIKKPSKRGLEMIGLLASGLTAKEIGERLGLSFRTVQNQFAINYPRIGARNAQGAAAWYVRNVEMKGEAR